jgi:hypothetical protein
VTPVLAAIFVTEVGDVEIVLRGVADSRDRASDFKVDRMWAPPFAAATEVSVTRNAARENKFIGASDRREQD